MPRNAIIERRAETINRKDILNEIQSFRREFSGHAEADLQRDGRLNEQIKEDKNTFNRHLEIYAANGKEMAGMKVEMKNLGVLVEEVKKIISGGEVKSDGQGVDLSKLGADVEWLKKFFWVVITASVGSVVTAIFTIIKSTPK